MVEASRDYEWKVRNFASLFDGFFNAHAHIDRAFTYDDEYYSHRDISLGYIEGCSLTEKQRLAWTLHVGSAFTPESLEERMTRVLEDSIRFGVSRLDSSIDVTYNTQLKAWEIAEKLKEKYKGRIDFRLGAYNIAGFKDSRPERAELFEEAVKRGDFIVALAEKDRKPGHIGERQHNVYLLNLGIKYGKPVHFHVGQANSPSDRGSELLFDCMDWVYDVQHRLANPPRNFVVHDISAACYSEEDFAIHCDRLLENNLGVICCPKAAISMRQDRKVLTPTHNSTARVWDYALKKIPVFLGTDNINDVFIPSSTPNLYDEIVQLSDALRFYNPWILAKVACGKELDDFDRGKIQRALFPS